MFYDLFGVFSACLSALSALSALTYVRKTTRMWPSSRPRDGSRRASS
jgi:hypothetical protein